MTDTVLVNARVSRETRAALQRVADNADLSLSDLIRQALDNLLDSMNGDPMPKLNTLDDLHRYVLNSTRYAFLTDTHGTADLTRVHCRDCSTRTTIVMIPSIELADHERNHA